MIYAMRLAETEMPMPQESRRGRQRVSTATNSKRLD
jgi:hypothetical protein